MTFNYNEYRLHEINRTLSLYECKDLTSREKDLVQHLEEERDQIVREIKIREEDI